VIHIRVSTVRLVVCCQMEKFMLIVICNQIIRTLSCCGVFVRFLKGFVRLRTSRTDRSDFGFPCVNEQGSFYFETGSFRNRSYSVVLYCRSNLQG